MTQDKKPPEGPRWCNYCRQADRPPSHFTERGMCKLLAILKRAHAEAAAEQIAREIDPYNTRHRR